VFGGIHSAGGLSPLSSLAWPDREQVRIVQAAIGSGHGTDGAVVVGALGDHLGAKSAASFGSKPDQLTGVVVADGAQGAVVNDDARAATQHNLVLCGGDAARWAYWSDGRGKGDGERRRPLGI
jgi:hypothetical protein